MTTKELIDYVEGELKKGEQKDIIKMLPKKPVSDNIPIMKSYWVNVILGVYTNLTL